ncbi:MAG TPA: hypothetical protein VHM90_16835 [Phycisphaerae bacterium]|jgi:hypothetical protein|nr:hypothetical protein [Phycisphaerae bacterium]
MSVASSILGSSTPLLPRLAGWDRRSIRILVLMAAVMVLNAIDLDYTVFANSMTVNGVSDMFREMNPLGAVFLQLGLVPSLVCFKILMVFCGLGLLWKVRRSKWAVPACWLLLVAFVGLSVMWCVWIGDANQALETQLALSAP